MAPPPSPEGSSRAAIRLARLSAALLFVASATPFWITDSGSGLVREWLGVFWSVGFSRGPYVRQPGTERYVPGPITDYDFNWIGNYPTELGVLPAIALILAAAVMLWVLWKVVRIALVPSCAPKVLGRALVIGAAALLLGCLLIVGVAVHDHGSLGLSWYFACAGAIAGIAAVFAHLHYWGDY